MDIQTAKAFVWAWVLPVICLFGLGANAINIRVFSARRSSSKNRLHTYLRIDSIVEFVYLLIVLVHFAFRHSAARSSLLAVAYDKYLYNYVASSLAFFMVFTKLFISLKRIFILCNQRLRVRMLRLKSLLVCFFFVSFLFDITFLVGVSVEPVEHANSNASSSSSIAYYLSYRTSESSPTIRAFYYFSSGFRGLLAPLLLLGINIFFLKKLAERLNTINEIFSDPLQRTQARLGINGIYCNHLGRTSIKIRRSITKMLVGTNFLFIVGNFSTFVTRVIAMTLTPASPVTHVSSIFSNTLLYLSHGLSLFFYYNFDSIYKESLFGILKRLHFMSKKPGLAWT